MILNTPPTPPLNGKKEKKMKVSELPNQRPDLNLIHMLLYDLKHSVHAWIPSNVDELNSLTFTDVHTLTHWITSSQEWHNQLLGSGSNDSFTQGQVDLDSFFVFKKWNPHLKTAFCNWGIFSLYLTHKVFTLPKIWGQMHRQMRHFKIKC